MLARPLAAQASSFAMPPGPSSSLGDGAVSASYTGATRPAALQSSYSSLDFRKDFFFRRRHGALDWTKLRSVDLERVVRTVDVDALQENVEHVTFADISEADLAQLTDANFLQLFRLTQLIIEYLLNVQNFLLASAKKKEATYEQIVYELESTRAALAQRTESERAAKKELKHCRRVIKAYERNLGAKWNELSAAPNAAASTASTASKCAICGSVFVNHEFLVGHYRRRHPDEQPPPPPAAAPQAAAPSPQPTVSQDLSAWKREMESALRVQLAESQRASAPPQSRARDSELADRLSKLESTLAAVLNNNVLTPTEANEPSAAKASRAGALRDDDGGARIAEDATHLKEFFRRQLFDLHEEVRSLKEERRDQAYFAPYHATHEPAGFDRAGGGSAPEPLPLTGSLSPQAEEHATALLHRFRSSPLPHARPHPPNYPHAVASPQGVGTIPRHIPSSPMSPSPPSSAAPSASLFSPSPPALPTGADDLRRLRDLLLTHSSKRYEPFADLPGLRARFVHAEADLVRDLAAFDVLATTLVEHDRTDEVEHEMRAQGCEDMLPEIEAEADEYVRAHFKRPPEMADAFRRLSEREARNETLGAQQAAAAAREQAQREAWQRQIEEIEQQRRLDEAVRERELVRQAQRREDALLQARAAEAQEAERVRLAHERHMQAIATTPFDANTPVHRPPPLTGISPSPSPMAAAPSPALPYPSTSPVSSASLSPSPYPTASPLPNMSPSLAPSRTLSASPPAVAAAAASPAPVPATSFAPSFSNHPDILNPRPAATKRPSTLQKQPSGGGLLQRSSGPLRSLDVDEDDADDEEDEEEKSSPPPRPTQRPAALTTKAPSPSIPGRPPLWSPPPAVPVPIPARPNKNSILGALSKPSTPAAPQDEDAVQPFTMDSDSPVLPASSPIPSLDSVRHRRNASRRLSARSEDIQSQSDELNLLLGQHGGMRNLRRDSLTQPLATPPELNELEHEHDTQYEHSTARRDHEIGEHEFGGLDHEYEQREADRREREMAAGGEDDVHHFSPPPTTGSSPVQAFGGSRRLHSDDEGDEPLPTSTRFSAALPAPTIRTRNVNDLRNAPSRFAAATTNQSANFSVTNSGDWKSDPSEAHSQHARQTKPHCRKGASTKCNSTHTFLLMRARVSFSDDILDDDVEELMA